MQDPLEVVRSFARRHQLWEPPHRVLAAVSGGSDSVAMFVLLAELAAAGEVQLAGLAHVNHRIRHAASDRDEAFCRALAARLGVQAVFAEVDVPALAREHRQSIEVAARHARRRALVDAAQTLQADRIATAHTRDDQAETMLLHLARGAGLSGARGIEPRSGAFIRPLLDCTRQDLRAWLTARGESWREDETNADLANPRNRMRHVVLPALRQAFNPAVDAALGRFADILREDDAYLNSAAAEAAERLVSTRSSEAPPQTGVTGARVLRAGVETGKHGRGGSASLAAASLARLRRAQAEVVIDAHGLTELPLALGRRVARRALETVRPGRSYDLVDVSAVIDACREPSSGARDLRGVRMERSGRFVVLHCRDAPSSQPSSPLTGRGGPGLLRFEYELPVPGEVSIEESHAVIEAAGPFDSSAWRVAPDSLAQGRPFDVVQDRGSALICADELGEGLLVRNRREGDRLRLWNVGHKKLQDLFVDRKVDRFERDRVPIVTDRAGRIVWVAGHAVAEEFRVGPLTATVVTLTLRPLSVRGPRRA